MDVGSPYILLSHYDCTLECSSEQWECLWRCTKVAK